MSDFRLLRSSQLLIVERAGLLTAVANSTIAPGAFAWHVKGLASRGAIASDGITFTIGVESLALTWFLSSLYLSRLMAAIFAAPSASSADYTMFSKLAKLSALSSSGRSAAMLLVMALCLACLAGLAPFVGASAPSAGQALEVSIIACISA